MSLSRALWLLVLLAVARPAFAHTLSDSRLRVTAEQQRLRVAWAIAARDLDALLALDANGDGSVGANEAAAQREAVIDYALSRLELRAEGGLCLPGDVEIARAGDELLLNFEAACPAAPRQLALRYDLFFEHDPRHRGLVHLAHTGQSWSAVITAAQREHRFVLHTAAPWWQPLLAYLGEGVWHVWLGYDHLLFLLVLLLPAVLPGADERAGLRAVLVHVCKIVTAFTLAHSITLSLAALQLVQLPSRFIEAAIAASIAVAALNNLIAAFHGREFVLAFALGLLHGFGFANALTELGLPRAYFAPALIGFNTGVELGQLAIVAGFVPLAFAARHTGAYRSWGVRGGSWLALGVASLWFVERAYDLPLFDQLVQASRYARLDQPVALAGLALLALAGLGRLWARAAERRGHVHEGSLGRSRALAVLGAALLGAGLVASAAAGQRGLSELGERAGVARRAAERAWNSGRLQEARVHYQRAGELYQQAGDLASRADIDARLGDLALAQAEPEEARACYERALAVRAARHDERGVAAHHHQLAVVARVRGDLTEAARQLRRALEIEERLKLPRALARDSAELGAIYRETGELEAAASLLRRAVELEQSLGRTAALADQLSKLAIVEQLRGSLDEAGQLYRRAFALHEQLARPNEAASALANAGNVAREQGQLSEAQALYTRALARFEAASQPDKAERVRTLLSELPRHPE